MLVSFLSIAVNYGLNQLFTFHLALGHRGLALSTGFVALTNFSLLYWMMRRETKHLETRLMLVTFGKLAISGAALALVCHASQTFVLHRWTEFGFITRAVLLCSTISIGGLTFFVVAALLKIEEMNDLTSIVRRKMSRRKAA